ncbi:MAG: TrkA family potassium uptake protein [Nitrospinota bacterium]|nr:TrkA family potassium uptake protein [Nitrospinota bacterium]
MSRKFAVIGLGMFGGSLARSLYELGNDVLAVDNVKDIAQKMQDHCTRAVIADATDKDTLAELSLQDMDVVIIGLGAPLDTSILTTLYLKEMGVKEIWAKAVSDEHATILKTLGANRVIHPEKEMAEKLAATLSTPLMMDQLEVAEGYSIIEITCPPSFIDKSIMDLQLRNKYGVLMVAVKKPGEDTPIMLPTPDYVLRSGDVMVLMGSEKSLEDIFGTG